MNVPPPPSAALTAIKAEDAKRLGPAGVLNTPPSQHQPADAD